MSGHSKWATIKRKKGALDAKRGKIFTKLVKEISVAVKLGSSDPEANPRLRLAIQNAKAANVPKENIERAIKKGSGQDGADYVENTYEGYASNGVAVFVECTTENTNRTTANIRSIFSKNGGSLATSGSVDFLFERKGIFSIKMPSNLDMEDFELQMIDAGAEDLSVGEDYISVSCAMENFGSIQKKLDELKIEAEDAELSRIPITLVNLGNEDFLKVMKLIEAMEDDDDVQKVYHNLDVTEEQMSLV